MEFPHFLTNPNPQIFLTNNYLVLDFETTNIDKGDPINKQNSLLLSCWKYNGELKQYWGNEYHQNELIHDIEQADLIVCHNTMFELGWLLRCGIDVYTKQFYCTMIGEYVLQGNQTAPLDLDTVSKKYGFSGKESLVNKMIKRGTPPEEIPRSWLSHYCRQDVNITDQIFLEQRQLLKEKQLLPVVFSRNIVTPVLYSVQAKGMHLDPTRVTQKVEEISLKEMELDNQLHKITGGINIKSPLQMRRFLFETLEFEPPKDFKGNILTTPSGEISCGQEAMLALKATTQEQRTFLKLQKEAASTKDMLSKYLLKMEQCVKENNGILLGSISQTRTKTHRLASTGKKYKIQLQNIDRTLKPLFSARNTGWYMGEADEAQLEFRVAGILTNDPQIKQDIENKVDVHAVTASVIFDKEWNNPVLSEVQRKAIRTAAKADTFKPLFGGRSGSPKQKKYYELFRTKYHKTTQTLEKWIDDVIRTKQLKTITGLMFYWPNAKRSHTGYATNTTETSNSPIQSFAGAEIVPIALVFLWWRLHLDNLKSFITNTVHDSVVAEIHPKEVERFRQHAQLALTKDNVQFLEKLYNIKLNIPLEAEVTISHYWGEKDIWHK